MYLLRASDFTSQCTKDVLERDSWWPYLMAGITKEPRRSAKVWKIFITGCFVYASVQCIPRRLLNEPTYDVTFIEILKYFSDLFGVAPSDLRFTVEFNKSKIMHALSQSRLFRQSVPKLSAWWNEVHQKIPVGLDTVRHRKRIPMAANSKNRLYFHH